MPLGKIVSGKALAEKGILEGCTNSGYGVELYYNADTRLDIALARRELDFSPRDPEIAIRQTLQYLIQRFAPGT